MSNDSSWEPFRVFTDAGSANTMCNWLQLEQVPARVETRSLENAREAEYCVVVLSSLAHRARWIVAQLPPTERELDFLATGRLPGAE